MKRLLITTTSFFTILFSPQAQDLRISLPTDNDYIFSRSPEKFYMYTDRDFEGRKSRPWSGGKFGFTRNQKRTNGGVVMSGFHEGVDIKPLRRDSDGKPIDKVKSVADGVVRYTNHDARRSNYGKYVVVEHPSTDGPVFSLSAHLNAIYVKSGQKVARGQSIGLLGYTGRGINRRRAHVHLEINLLISDRFKLWHDQVYTSPNHHGIFNGRNMSGLDVADLLKKSRNSSLSLAKFVRSQDVFYKVRVGGERKFGRLVLPSLLKRYRFLVAGYDPAHKSWELSLSASGLPIKANSSARTSSSATLIWSQKSRYPLAYKTLRRVTNYTGKAQLTKSGISYARLIAEFF